VIVSDHSVALQDQDARIKLTLESIENWLAISSDLRLVICDGSNFDFSEIVRESFPKAHIECLHFTNNKELVKVHGKGFGEGEIVNYALQHSRYLKESEFFAKCTSKLWVENFLDCLRQWNGRFLCKGVFEHVFSIRPTEFSYVDTRFYLVEKSFYQTYLSTAYLNVGDRHGLSLEHCFMNVILANKFEHVLFNNPPVICGVGGGSGKYYKNNFKRRIKERFRAWLVRQNRAFSYLFQ
jgi:hypothetical protein